MILKMEDDFVLKVSDERYLSILKRLENQLDILEQCESDFKAQWDIFLQLFAKEGELVVKEGDCLTVEDLDKKIKNINTTFHNESDGVLEHINLAIQKVRTSIEAIKQYLKEDEENDTSLPPAYICILRFYSDAWFTPTHYPVGEVNVKYTGEIKGCIWVDYKWSGLKMETKVENGKFYCMGYYEAQPIMGFGVEEKDKLYKWDIPMCDATEWWGVIISDTPIQAENFLPGFRKTCDGKIFRNIADEKERAKRLSRFDF